MSILLRASLVILFAPAIGLAQNADDVLLRQVRAATETYEKQGFTHFGRDYIDELNEGKQVELELRLEVGDYYAIGACDQDCTDLDLGIYRLDGTEVKADLLEDDVPVVGISVTRAGQFKLRVGMAKCSVNPCKYVVATYQRRN